MKRIALLGLLVFSLGLVACGDDENTTETTSGSGPEGPLTAEGVGDVDRGATTAQVEAAFGEADRTETAPGCELSGPNAPQVLTWTYDLGDGELFLTFDSASGELGSYRNASPSLETTLGDKVGNDFASLLENWGSDLEPYPLGQPTPEGGLYVVRQDPEAELLFDVQDRAITAISGGLIQVCD